MWFWNRSDTSQAVQPQKTHRSLKFQIEGEEGLYFPSENKGSDQLRGYREADLGLCFRQCRLLVFPWGGSFVKLLIGNVQTASDAVFVCFMVDWFSE